jgi:serine/threonine protein kinase
MSWAGTELYMAPEQLDKREYGSEVDWWALGALAWEMATGDHPFYSNNRKAITHNIMKKKLVLPSWLPTTTHSLLKGLLTVSQILDETEYFFILAWKPVCFYISLCVVQSLGVLCKHQPSNLRTH